MNIQLLNELGHLFLYIRKKIKCRDVIQIPQLSQPMLIQESVELTRPCSP